MTYIDGCVAAVPTANKDAFLTHARAAAACFKDHGALHVIECWGDDVPDGVTTSFPMAVKKADDETVIFSWIVWPDKETRDKGHQGVMQDPRMAPDTNPMPFDGKRMIFGGFDVVLDS
ncbi:RNA signal recognition particle 4.5S RNA [Stappia sp. 22II-S9-Z10]|nr:RNA signal recognition particle 4.5S RNA [Stappia sp. 22II-S9-Z10]